MSTVPSLTDWLPKLDSNQRNTRVKILCLTTWLLGNMAQTEGFEPSPRSLRANGLANRPLNPLEYVCMVLIERVERPFDAYKATVLPLN